MTRKASPPRLWLRPGRGVWYIRDREQQIPTGFSEQDRDKAEAALKVYADGVRDAGGSFVYFITIDRENAPIRIGSYETHRVWFDRFRDALPYNMKILGIIPTNDRELKKRIHQKFAHLRVRGEWFQRSVEITDYIERLVRLCEDAVAGA